MSLEELREFLAQQVVAWQEADPPTIAQAFTPGGVLLAPGFQAVGNSQIETAAREYFSLYSQIKIEIRYVWPDLELKRVAVEWDWSDTNIATGEQLTTREAVMIDFDSSGKVSEWREYFNREKPTPRIEEVTA